MTEGDDFESTRGVAERVVDLLRQEKVDTLVVGAMALAAHNYPRATEDFDLAVAVPPSQLERLADALRATGFTVELRAADGQDPLGGVIDVRAPGASLVQIVNFDNTPAGGFPAVIFDGLARSVPLMPGSALRVTDLGSLIAMKLYAGGAKSKLDVLELLERNPQLDLTELRTRCKAYRLGKELERVIALRDTGE